MAGTRITDNYPPHLEPTRAPIAYGNRALLKMNEDLESEETWIRQRTIRSLCDYLKDPEHIASAIRLGTVDTIIHLLSDTDVTVRQKSAECLDVMSRQAVGREAFVTKKVVEHLLVLFDDDSDEVRKHAHAAFAMAAISPVVTGLIMEQKLVGTLVSKLRTENDDIIELLLDTLHDCFRQDVAEALACGCMKILTYLLGHCRETIRYRACRNIMGLATTLDGKKIAVEEKCMDELVSLLKDDNTRVRANAAGAVHRISTTTLGKYTALEAGALNALILLLDDVDSEVRLNVLKALTSLSEAPEGRAILLQHVHEVIERQADHVPGVAEAAIIAVAKIQWKP